MEGLKEVLEQIKKTRQEQIDRLEELYKSIFSFRDKLNSYEGIEIQKVSDEESFYKLLVAGVDSSYALQKNRLGGVEYYWVGVGADLSKFHYTNEELPTVFNYMEESIENEFLMRGIATLIEFSLAMELVEKVDYVFLDGSFFTSYLNMERAYTLCKRFDEGNYKFVNYFKETYKQVKKGLINLLRSNKLCAFPKRSSQNELVEFLSKKEETRLHYRDAELVDILLEKGEYIDISSILDHTRLENYMKDVYARANESSEETDKLSEEIKKLILEKFKLFYVKGAGGGVIRVEFFSDGRFPAEVIYSQNLTDTNELQIIIEADRLAKNYLKILLDTPNLLGNYRLL